MWRLFPPNPLSARGGKAGKAPKESKVFQRPTLELSNWKYLLKQVERI